MKKKGTTLLLTIPLILSGCSSNNKIYKIIDLDTINNDKGTYLKSIDEDNIISYLDNNFSFMLYQYGSTCSYCKTAGEAIYTIQKEYHYQIYGYEVSEQYDKLYESYPNIFIEKASYPKFYIFSKGKLVSESVGRDAITSQLFLRRIKDYNEDKSIYTFSTLESFNYIKETFNNYYLFTYQSNNKSCIDSLAYACDIYKEKDPLLVLDITSIKEDLKQKLIQELQIEDSLINSSLSYIVNQKKEKSLDYLNHTKEDINTMFSSL